MRPNADLLSPRGTRTLLSSVRKHLPRLAAGLLIAWPTLASAHDLRLELEELERGVNDIGRAIERLHARPPIARPPKTRPEHLRVLGEAEIERALGNNEVALRKLLGRLADPSFRKLPEYVPTLLLASQILEDTDDPVGAMLLARRALEQGGSTDQMAEAGARWFRLARRQNWMADRNDVLQLWRAQGGAGAAGVDMAAEAAYEAAFALREYDKKKEAQQLLSTIPSESRYGSRAAYLSGVIFVESGDLSNAERWFAAIMAWPIPPALDDNGPQKRLEKEVRELAAMSAGRLRYERGDLEGADAAYRLVGDGSRHQADACYELAFLALEMKRRRGAMMHLQCVTDLGAKGERYVDVRLTRASLLAHLARYSESVAAYETLHEALKKERKIVQDAITGLPHPSGFLFEAMERTSISEGHLGTPGPATVFGDSWSADVDYAYRLDRDVGHAGSELSAMLAEIKRIRTVLDRIDVFPPLENRRRIYQQLLREIQHLQGHAGDLAVSAQRGHADASGEHGAEAADASRLLASLDRFARRVEAAIEDLTQEEVSRRAQAERTLRELEAEARSLAGVARGLAGEVTTIADVVGKEALDALSGRYDHAVMKSEAGVLDTYWIRKEHVSEQIRSLGEAQEKVRDEYNEAIREASEELRNE